MEKIVIIGSSGHAKVVTGIVEREGRYEVAGYLDQFRKSGESTLGYPVLGQESDLPALVAGHGVAGVLIAIGDNFVRAAVAARVRELCPALRLISAIHPAASIARDALVGAGSVVMAGAVVNGGAVIGQCCILNTKSSLDHDSVMADFSSLAPGATTGGNCQIGTGAAVGLGANLIHGVRIGEHTVVGAGATVIRSLEASCLAYGTPARAVRPRIAGEPYL